jgi:hypothetical protein
MEMIHVNHPYQLFKKLKIFLSLVSFLEFKFISRLAISFHLFMHLQKLINNILHAQLKPKFLFGFLIPPGIQGDHPISLSFDGFNYSNAIQHHLMEQKLPNMVTTPDQHEENSNKSILFESFCYSFLCYLICTLKINKRLVRKTKETNPLINSLDPDSNSQGIRKRLV